MSCNCPCSFDPAWYYILHTHTADKLYTSRLFIYLLPISHSQRSGSQSRAQRFAHRASSCLHLSKGQVKANENTHQSPMDTWNLGSPFDDFHSTLSVCLICLLQCWNLEGRKKFNLDLLLALGQTIRGTKNVIFSLRLVNLHILKVDLTRMKQHIYICP